MSKRLHRHTGAIVFRGKVSQQVGRATGILISPDLVLTGAQNVWNRRGKEEYVDHVFYVAQSGELKDGKSIQKIFYPSSFKNRESVE